MRAQGILAVANRVQSWFDPIQVLSHVPVTQPLLAQELPFAVRGTFITIVVAKARDNVSLVGWCLHCHSRLVVNVSHNRFTVCVVHHVAGDAIVRIVLKRALALVSECGLRGVC